MNDTRTLIQSSIISLIIVFLGLFMLCMGGPGINLDDPLIDGEYLESESYEMSDEEFLDLLDSANDEMAEVDETDSEVDLESFILGENNETESESEIVPDEQFASDVSEDELSEILQLLDIEKGESTEPEYTEAPQEKQSELQRLLSLEDDTETTENAKLKEEDYSETYSELEEELDKLEKVLNTKNSQIDSIRTAINEYDLKIADLENGDKKELIPDYPTKSSKNVFRFASYSSNPEEQAIPTIQNRTFSSSSSVQEMYDTALNFFNNRNYNSAISEFETILQQSPNHSLADNCQYWIGECYFAQRNYYQAIVEFEKVFSFDAADKKDDAQIMLGVANKNLGESKLAFSDFEWFVAFYDNSEYYHKAIRYMSEL